MDLLTKIVNTPLTPEARQMLKEWMDASEEEEQTDDSGEPSDADLNTDACKEMCLSSIAPLRSNQRCRN